MNGKNDKDYDDIEKNKNNTYEKNDYKNKNKNRNRNKNKRKNNNKCDDGFLVTRMILFCCPHQLTCLSLASMLAPLSSRRLTISK